MTVRRPFRLVAFVLAFLNYVDASVVFQKRPSYNGRAVTEASKLPKPVESQRNSDPCEASPSTETSECSPSVCVLLCLH